MNIRAIAYAAIFAVSAVGPSFGLESSSWAGLTAGQAHFSGGHVEAGQNQLLHAASCNVNDEDKQAYCMRACEEEYVDSSQQYNIKPEDRMTNRKTCETKCGC